MLSFVIVFSNFFVLGLLLSKSKIKFFFLTLIFFLPWGGYLQNNLSIALVHPVIGILYGRFTFFILGDFKEMKISKSTFTYILIIFLICAYYLYTSSSNIEILSREIISIFNWIILAFCIIRDKSTWNINNENFMYFWILYLAKIILYNMVVKDIDQTPSGQYFVQNNGHYSDLAVLFLFFFCTVGVTKILKILRFISILPYVLISGSDTILMLYFLVGLWILNTRLFISAIVVSLTALVVGLLFLQPDQLSWFYYYYGSRNSPLITHFGEMSVYKSIFGSGLGVGIEIPWFDASKSDLGKLSVFYDNLFGTIFIKFGVFGLMCLIFVLSKIFQKSKLLFMLICSAGMTGSVLYQTSFLVMIYLYYQNVKPRQLQKLRSRITS